MEATVAQLPAPTTPIYQSEQNAGIAGLTMDGCQASSGRLGEARKRQTQLSSSVYGNNAVVADILLAVLRRASWDLEWPSKE